MKDRIVLVTGATRGLGLAIAENFTRGGAKVALNYAHDDVAATSAKERLSALGTVELFKADALSADGVESLVASVRETSGVKLTRSCSMRLRSNMKKRSMLTRMQILNPCIELL